MCPQYTFSTTTNRITNSNFTYDSAGDLTQDGTGTGTHTYQYDAEGRLFSVDNGTTASYVYNALGERAERNVGGTYTEYVYDQDGSEVGDNNRTTWTESWAAFQGRHLFHFSGGSTYFTHMDSLGTTSIVTDYSTGAVVQDELHYPWGQEWTMLGTMQEERFAHLHHRDNETNLDPTLHRMFSSNQGRWLTPDPLHGHTRTPQSLNRYGYALNNPGALIDPSGLYACAPGYVFSCSTWGYVPNACSADGIEIPCGFAQDLIGAGIAAACPDNACRVPLWAGNLTAVGQFNPNTGMYEAVTPWTFLGESLQQFQSGYFAQFGMAIQALQWALQNANISSAAVNAFIQANNSPNWGTVQNEGGNFDFQGASLFGNLADTCSYLRCETPFGTLDFGHSGGTFHLDTGDPYNFPSGTSTHVWTDILGGNFWWSIIPR